MKVFKILIIILLLIFPASLLCASEPSLGWKPVSKNPLLWPDNPQITNIDNKIYMSSGRYDYNAKTCISKHQCYDLGTNTWSDKANMNVSRYCTKTAAVNGKIYAFGGKVAYLNSSIVNVVEEYDPIADTWTVKSPLPVKKLKPEVIAFNNKIYTIGGCTTEYGPYNLRSVEEYDPGTDTWTTKAPLSDINRLSITSLVYDNKIYVFSATYGQSPSDCQIILQIYDPMTDTWENKETVNLNYRINSIFAALLDNKNYLCIQRENIGQVLLNERSLDTQSQSNIQGNEIYRYDPANNNYQYLSVCSSFRISTNFVMLNNVPYACNDSGGYLYKAVLGHPPVLAYIGETGYEQDAIEPNEIKLNTTYTFKVRFFDEDNEPPADGLRLCAGSYINGYIMQASDPLDNNYVDGKDYYYTFKSSIENGWPTLYYVSTTDQIGLYASLDTMLIDLKIAASEYPFLSPIEISLKVGTLFTFRVKYTDPNNLPPAGDMRIRIENINHSSYSDYEAYYVEITEEDQQDTDYQDGKYFKGTTCFKEPGDFRAVLQLRNQLYLSTAEVISDTFTVTAQPFSDLRITDIDYQEEKISAGLQFENTFWISNLGTGEADFEAEYYLSPTKSLIDAYKLKIMASPGDYDIPIDNDVKLTYSVLVPPSTPQASYYLGILCKADNNVTGDYLYWYDNSIQVLAGTASNSPGAAYGFPSPAYLSKGDKIHFALLPADSEISIMLPSGDVIKRFRADSNGYVPPWDGATDHDGQIGSGVYLVHIDSPLCDNKKLFKILVFR